MTDQDKQKSPKKKIVLKKSPQNTSWGVVSDWYDSLLEEGNDTYQEKVILPNLLRVIGPKKGDRILDVACGQGYFSRALHLAGAEVVGIDISKELIDLATTNSPKDIKYLVSSAENVTRVLSGVLIDHPRTILFDTAIIVLALQNIKDIKQTFVEISKILRPGGRIIFVLNHPTFRIPKRSSWGWDDTDQIQYRRIDAYMSDMSTDIDMHPGHKYSPETISFHRPLQAYFKALQSSGFTVTRLEEWISHKKSQKGPRQNEEDRIRKEIPMFMCIEGKKI